MELKDKIYLIYEAFLDGMLIGVFGIYFLIFQIIDKSNRLSIPVLAFATFFNIIFLSYNFRAYIKFRSKENLFYAIISFIFPLILIRSLLINGGILK